MQHIGDVIGSIFDRGTLPERVQVRETMGPIAAGSVLSWSAQDRAYMHHTGRWVVWALTVRQGWGRIFEAYAAPCAAQQATNARANIIAA